MSSTNGGSFGHNFSALSEESQLHATMTGNGRPLSSSGTSSASGSSSAVAPSSMETTSSVTTASSNSPPIGSSASVKAASYESHSRLIAGYPRLPGFYGSTYSSEQSTLYPANSASFYPSLSTHYELDKSTGNSWTPLASQTPYSAYEPHHSFYSPYSNCYGAIDSAARRKNATRETTNTLKAWLYEHRKNPYPTKGEKIMLAIITKMTLTQVSTWFANARRRLKKENKMTWEPKNKSTDARDDSDKESCKNLDDDMSDKNSDNGNGLRIGVKEESNEATTVPNSAVPSSTAVSKGHLLSNHALNGPHQQIFADGDHLDGQRPKIWSLAQTATSDASSLAGRLYPEWYAFQSNNVSDNLLLNTFPEPYHHHHHHHHHHQTGQHVQSPTSNFYAKGSSQTAGHWSEEPSQHGNLAGRAGVASNGPSGNFACSPVPFLPEASSVAAAPSVPHHFILQQHRAQIPTS